MEIGQIIPHIEALIFASDRPLSSLEITELINNAFGFMEDKVTLEQVSAAIDGIVEKYASDFYPFEVRESGGGWQFLTKKDYHKTIAQLNGDKYLKRLSNAALETLAIIAYKQPVTKADIEAIRGVSSDYSIQKLLEKELIVITGRNEDLPGKPLVYGTSKNFMDYFGLNSPDDLPKLQEIYQESVEPTEVEPQEHQKLEEEGEKISDFEASGWAVSESGELTDYNSNEEDNASPETAEQEKASETGSNEPAEENEQTDTAPNADVDNVEKDNSEEEGVEKEESEEDDDNFEEEEVNADDEEEEDEDEDEDDEDDDEDDDDDDDEEKDDEDDDDDDRD
jgi:segregation and condensation protein B